MCKDSLRIQRCLLDHLDLESRLDLSLCNNTINCSPAVERSKSNTKIMDTCNQGLRMDSTIAVKKFYGTKLLQACRKKKLNNDFHFPVDFPKRLCGPTACWKTFYRQQEAFDFLASGNEDLHVFGYEPERQDFSSGTGQRVYLVTSRPMFWHYYRQLEPSRRHHYEIIPEGTACKLYFDLEFQKEFNVESDGPRMVNLLIQARQMACQVVPPINNLALPGGNSLLLLTPLSLQYVSAWLDACFKIKCSRSDVLDLDASTSAKFSRHLIFVLRNVAFKDNVNMGLFVRHIFSHLMAYLQRHEPEKKDEAVKQLSTENSGFALCQPVTSKIGGDSSGQKRTVASQKNCVENVFLSNSDRVSNIGNLCENEGSVSRPVNYLDYKNAQSEQLLLSELHSKSNKFCNETNIDKNDLSEQSNLKNNGRKLSSNLDNELKQVNDKNEKFKIWIGGKNDRLEQCNSSIKNGTAGDQIMCKSVRSSLNFTEEYYHSNSGCGNSKAGGQTRSNVLENIANRKQPSSSTSTSATTSANDSVLIDDNDMEELDCDVIDFICDHSFDADISLVGNEFFQNDNDYPENLDSTTMNKTFKNSDKNCWGMDHGKRRFEDSDENNLKVIRDDTSPRLGSESSVNTSDATFLKCDDRCVSLEILEAFTHQELSSLVVKNKDGADTLFSDLAVYSKNRNFRLYLSSKLNRNNPLKVSTQNQFRDGLDRKLEEKDYFYASLITNVDSSSKLLDFEAPSCQGTRFFRYRQGASCAAGRHQGKNLIGDSLQGYGCTSPYTEVDHHILSLVSGGDKRGSIRQWTYFKDKEVILYDIVGHRWCGNIGREHRSNNIMYVVDLRETTYYQKCHDPDCQLVGYKSEALSLPAKCLPWLLMLTENDSEDQSFSARHTSEHDAI